MTALAPRRHPAGVWWWECLPPCPSLGYSDLWCRALAGMRWHLRRKHGTP